MACPTRPAIHCDQEVADLRSPLTELASGVDALYLSARCLVPAALLERLDRWRALAQEFASPVPFDLGGVPFRLAPHGWGKYRYCLEHEGARLGLSTSTRLPAVRVQFRTEYLHAAGPEVATAFFADLLGEECGPLAFTVSRLDLYADWQGWTLDADDRHRFVCRAGAVRTFEANGHLTGFTFGSRSTNTFTARIYDKTADVRRRGSEWWHDVWGERHVAGLPVLRVEFEIGRQGLAQFRIDAPHHALDRCGDLWRYATTTWLSHRSPTGDGNRSRWPVSAPWQAVQRASLVTRLVGQERITQRQKAATLRKLMPGLTGYLVGFASLVQTEDIDDTLGELLVTPSDAAELLSISRTSLYALMASGAVASVKVGGCRRIPVDALRAFVRDLPTERWP